MFLSFVSRLIASFMACFQFQTHDQVVSLKLLVNPKTNKVLFAEAGKDFVDILCSFLTLPLGTISRLLEKESNIRPLTVGCLNSLYQSVENLGLHPTYNSSEDYCNSLKININHFLPKKYYFICNKSNHYYHHCPYLSIGTNQNYCSCGNRLNRSVYMTKLGKGFVRKATSFVISDDLTVLPYSMNQTIFSLTKNFGIKSTSSVIEMTVDVTMEKVLDLLKLSLFSKTPLTDLFLETKPLIEKPKIFSYDVKNISYVTTPITVKLVVRKSDGNILYAQGGQDFANLIIDLLTFSLGGVLHKLEGNSSLGSIDRLYKSIADLNKDKYFMDKEASERLVKSNFLKYYCYYKCYPPNHYYAPSTIKEVTLFKSHENCCRGEYTREMKIVDTISSTGNRYGYVKKPEMYMVTDDLVIEPLLAPISSLFLLNRFQTPLNDLKEQVVVIGNKESLSILKATLTSTSALTNGLRHLLTKVKSEEYY